MRQEYTHTETWHSSLVSSDSFIVTSQTHSLFVSLSKDLDKTWGHHWKLRRCYGYMNQKIRERPKTREKKKGGCTLSSVSMSFTSHILLSFSTSIASTVSPFSVEKKVPESTPGLIMSSRGAPTSPHGVLFSLVKREDSAEDYRDQKQTKLDFPITW